MDIFTHMFFTYLLNFGMQTLKYNEYAMVFGIVIGVIPDFDVLWFPLGKKYPIWRHRGGSHSIFFITIETVILAWIFAPIINVNIFVLILIGIISGGFHILFDICTTIGIPALWPLSNREFHLDLERAINPYVLGISGFLILFLFYLRGIKFNYAIYLILINIILAGIFLYYLSKLILKIYIQRKLSTHDFKFKGIPTAGVFKWFMVGKKVENDILTLKYSKYNIIDSQEPKFKRFECDFNLGQDLPLANLEDAKAYSYNLKEVKSFLGKFKYPLAEVVERKSEKGTHWTIFWYPIELLGLDRSIAIQINLTSDGKYSSKYSLFKKISNL